MRSHGLSTLFKFLCNVESENVFPLLAKEFGCRLQATPGQAKEEAMERDATGPAGPFIAQPALSLLDTLPVAIALLPLLNSPGFPRNNVKKLKFAQRGPRNSKIRAPERRPT